MADVFKRTELRYGGGFSTNQGLITAKGLTGVLMQNLGINYSQNVNRIYEIGERSEQAAFVYYVGGRSQGSMNVGHVLGPKVTMAAYYQKFSDVCLGDDNQIVLDLSDSVCPRSSNGIIDAVSNFALGRRRVKYTALYCVLTQIGMTVSSEQMLVNQQSSLMFSNLQYDEAG